MKLIVTNTKEELGALSAKQAADALNEAIKANGGARLLLSTGASQFPFFNEFINN